MALVTRTALNEVLVITVGGSEDEIDELVDQLLEIADEFKGEADFEAAVEFLNSLAN